jgi:hypothetical protein
MSRNDVVLIILSALFAAVLATFAMGAEPALQNPSFEEAMDPVNYTCDIAKNWTRWGHWINRETGWQPTKSGECLIGYHHWEINGTENSGLSQLVTGVKKDMSYTFSIFVFVDKDTNAESIQLRLSDGKQDIADQQFEIKPMVRGEWTSLSVTGKALSEKMWVNIIVEPMKNVVNQWDRKGAIKLDDADFHATEVYK